MQTLFDENGNLNISDIVLNHPSYKKIMEDGIVTDEELKEQSEATIRSLKKLMEICDIDQQTAILEAIAEMSVLFSVYHTHQLQNLKSPL